MTRTFIKVSALAVLASAFAFPGAAATLDELFDDRVVHEIRLTTHPSDWQKLRDNYTADTYYVANFQWRGSVVEEVGIRSRGNGSRYSAKPGLKLDFNKYEPNQEFLGLKSLVLDNLTQDQTMMSERLSMLMFRRMGLPAPREAYARLYVNGAYAGLYTIVEPVDKGFLMRTLREDTGHLYDYEWATEYWFEYLGSDPSAYSPAPFQPQTNEKAPDARPLAEMIRVINQSSDAEFAAAVSRHLDLKLFLDYLATETFIAELDGILGEWGLNNFYLYRFSGSNLSQFIPWDKDVTMRQAERSIWTNAERNVLTRRLLKVPEMREHYLQALERCMELAGGPGGWLEQEIERQYGQIKAAVADDPNKPFTYAQFEEGVSYLRYFAFTRPQMIMVQIADSRAGQGTPEESTQQ